MLGQVPGLAQRGGCVFLPRSPAPVKNVFWAELFDKARDSMNYFELHVSKNKMLGGYIRPLNLSDESLVSRL